jgi:hypothetical protein
MQWAPIKVNKLAAIEQGHTTHLSTFTYTFHFIDELQTVVVLDHVQLL